jgi:catechol 2,3-dioxygenase-like lactoylglutathione lyase family enzyme
MTRLLHDIAHLGHAELLTPEPENSLWFFTEVLGLTENGTSGDSVYLRTWDDYEYHSLKLTASATSGIGRTGLRAASEQALERRVAEIERHGLGAGWQDGDLGIGPTYLFRDPDGHELHHVAFATDTREDVLRAADICLDRQVFIETGRTSTPSSRRSSSTSTSAAGTGSSCATHAQG